LNPPPSDEQVQPGGVPVERVRARPVGLPVLLFGAVVQRVVVVLLLMQELLQLLCDDFDRIEHEILHQGDTPRGEYPVEGKTVLVSLPAVVAVLSGD